MSKGELRRNLFQGVVFLGSFLVYLYTLSPTITLEDSGELITAAHTMGIAHPSGYPLYVFLGKLFTLLPMGDISWTAWKVNLMSAFFAALSCLVLYHILLKHACHPWIALCGAFVGGFSKIVWSQSVIAEVYTLHAFLFLTLMYLLYVWEETRKDKFLFMFSGLLGLSLTNHTVMILYIPLFCLWMGLNLTPPIQKITLLKCVGLFVLGVSFYIYIPLRMLAPKGLNESLNFGNLHAFKDVFFHISRAQYQTLDFASSISLQERFLFVLHFFKSLTEQYGPGIWVLGILGLLVLFKKNVKLFLIYVGLFLLGSLGLIFIRNFHYVPENVFITRVYYINSYFIFVIFIGIGCQFLYQKFSAKIWRFTLSFLFVIPFFYHFSTNNQRNNTFSYLHGKAILSSLPPSSFLLHISSDDFLFPLTYLKMVEKERPDITGVDAYGAIFRTALGHELCRPCPKDMGQARQFQKRVEIFLKEQGVENIIYFEPENLDGKKFINFGLFYTQKEGSLTQLSHPFLPFEKQYEKILNYPLSGNHFFENRVLAAYVLRYGETLYLQGNSPKALEQFERAASLNPTDHEIYYTIGRFLTSQHQYSMASTYFSRALSLHPYLAEAYNGLGAIALKEKKYEQAIPYFKKALELAIYNKEVLHFNLGYSLLKNGDIPLSYPHLKLALKLNPENYFAAYHLAQASIQLEYYKEAQALLENLLKQVPQQSAHLQKLISNIKKKTR
ncbi:MAG: DUF2723 domain-containing protein [Deltaproteobacteria bacterium]|nr:DUF2723 domain-containing protein [Deltaproteobacteria bacterium]